MKHISSAPTSVIIINYMEPQIIALYESDFVAIWISVKLSFKQVIVSTLTTYINGWSKVFMDFDNL